MLPVVQGGRQETTPQALGRARRRPPTSWAPSSALPAPAPRRVPPPPVAAPSYLVPAPAVTSGRIPASVPAPSAAGHSSSTPEGRPVPPSEVEALPLDSRPEAEVASHARRGLQHGYVCAALSFSGC
ncbi:cyclin-dependent kinase inhibitor 1C-like [Hyaena hyaena]|uniref:cyclin-dependent kinase inhibitor 1C-like n=1 Tax=Hyaena hyaena TaxID=95912 RepID=UPI0019250A14|nr:cyclin-dependent kinase inhibitor 1C-like [Hyaena hyaena]